MSKIVAALAVLLMVSFTGCGSEEPALVADPNEYEAFQATPEEIAEQAKMAQEQAARNN